MSDQLSKCLQEKTHLQSQVVEEKRKYEQLSSQKKALQVTNNILALITIISTVDHDGSLSIINFRAVYLSWSTNSKNLRKGRSLLIPKHCKLSKS